MVLWSFWMTQRLLQKIALNDQGTFRPVFLEAQVRIRCKTKLWWKGTDWNKPNSSDPWVKIFIYCHSPDLTVLRIPHKPCPASREWSQASVNSQHCRFVLHLFIHMNTVNGQLSSLSDSNLLMYCKIHPPLLQKHAGLPRSGATCCFRGKREQGRTTSFSSSLLLHWIRCNVKRHF